MKNTCSFCILQYDIYTLVGWKWRKATNAWRKDTVQSSLFVIPLYPNLIFPLSFLLHLLYLCCSSGGLPTLLVEGGFLILCESPWEPSCTLLRSEPKSPCSSGLGQSHQKGMEVCQGWVSPPSATFSSSGAISALGEKNNLVWWSHHLKMFISGSVPIALNIQEGCFYLLKWEAQAHMFSSTQYLVSWTSVGSSEGMAECNWGLKAGVAGQEVITPTLSWQLEQGPMPK